MIMCLCVYMCVCHYVLLCTLCAGGLAVVGLETLGELEGGERECLTQMVNATSQDELQALVEYANHVIDATGHHTQAAHQR